MNISKFLFSFYIQQNLENFVFRSAQRTPEVKSPISKLVGEMAEHKQKRKKKKKKNKKNKKTKKQKTKKQKTKKQKTKKQKQKKQKTNKQKKIENHAFRRYFKNLRNECSLTGHLSGKKNHCDFRTVIFSTKKFFMVNRVFSIFAKKLAKKFKFLEKKCIVQKKKMS